MKIYGADHDIIISGANLSHDYFTNRQDRYVRLSDQPELSDYLFELIKVTCSVSYQLSEAHHDRDMFQIVWPKTNASCPPDGSRKSSDQFKSTSHQLYQQFTDRWRQRSIAQTRQPHLVDDLQSQVTIFPILQMNPFKINHETCLMIPRLVQLAHEMSSTTRLSAEARTRVVLNWTSGYFSLLREYKRQMLLSDTRIEIITASPEANGFFQSKGVSQHIPSAYSYLENMFMKDVRKSNKRDQITIGQWRRAGWTYHAKGVWLTQVLETGSKEHELTQEECILTTIGSSNYGRRSAERDLECNLLMILNERPSKPKMKLGDDEPQKQLSTDLVAELNHLRAHVEPHETNPRKVGILIKFLTRLIRNMLWLRLMYSFTFFSIIPTFTSHSLILINTDVIPSILVRATSHGELRCSKTWPIGLLSQACLMSQSVISIVWQRKIRDVSWPWLKCLLDHPRARRCEPTTPFQPTFQPMVSIIMAPIQQGTLFFCERSPRVRAIRTHPICKKKKKKPSF